MGLMAGLIYALSFAGPKPLSPGEAFRATDIFLKELAKKSPDGLESILG